MGVYDTVRFIPKLKCSEGHELEDFQTKDTDPPGFDGWTVEHDLLSHDHDRRLPFTGTMRLCAFCDQCPCYIQPRTKNICSLLVEYEARFDRNEMNSIERVSDNMEDWLESEPKQDHMKGCSGPYASRAEAMKSR